MRVPCYKCEDRRVGCHGECEKYIEFRKEREVIYQKRAEEVAVREYQSQKMIENWKRRKRKERK